MRHIPTPRPRITLTLSLFPFSLLPRSYEPNTLDINSDEDELRWWLDILRQQIPTVVEKACASEGGGEAARRRAAAFGRCARKWARTRPEQTAAG